MTYVDLSPPCTHVVCMPRNIFDCRKDFEVKRADVESASLAAALNFF